MAQDKVIVGGNVSGNVTSCENKEIVVGIDRKSVFSIKQTQSFLVYNQCTGNEVSRYQYEGVTGFGVFSGISLAFIVVMAIMVLGTRY